MEVKVTKLKLSKKTILRGFKTLSTESKLNAMYVEIINIKRRVKYLNEFNEMKLPEFINKQVDDSLNAARSKNQKLQNRMNRLTTRHKEIKDNLTWQSRANEILKEELCKLGVNREKLNDDMQKLHKEWKGTKA
jgi:uncharacterized protein YhaN